MVTAEPILTNETWRAVKLALDSRKQKRAERVGGRMLLMVAYCAIAPTGDRQQRRSLTGGSSGPRRPAGMCRCTGA